MAAEVRLDVVRLHELTRGRSGPVWQYANTIGRAIVNRAKIEAPVDSGRLRADHQFTVTETSDGVVVRIGTGVEYALSVYNGRRAIEAAPGKVLRFVLPTGEVVYAKRVRAVAPNRWLDRAVQAVTGLPITRT